MCLVSHSVRADNWPNWRGPNQNSVAEGESYPTQWGEAENIAWKVEIPGGGTSTPAIWGQQIFMTFADADKNGLICLNRQGEKLWQVELGSSAGNRNQKASGANPSPVTDGAHVYGYYRSGQVACVDFAGRVIWQTNLQEKYGKDALWWDLGTSPVLTKDFVVIAVMHQGPSYLAAFDKTTGQLAWKHDRQVEAPGEARDSYTTPLVIDDHGREVILVLGADHVTAHAAATGEEIWRVGGLNPKKQGNYRSIASPVVVEDRVFAPYSRGETLTAIKSSGTGDVTDSNVLWTIDSTASDVPSPVAFEGKLYLCGDRGDVTCLDPQTGDEIWVEKLPRNRYPFSSSPIIAGGNLYATREDGTTFVLQVGDKPRLLSTNSVNEFTYATPVFVDGRIYLRSSEYLICIGKDS
jgi:outer membrane protein assembly factor BamB